MVKDELLDKQVEADIERTKALTREVESKIKLNEIQAEILKQELARKK